MKIKVKELINMLEEIENKEEVVYVYVPAVDNYFQIEAIDESDTRGYGITIDLENY